MHWERQPPNRTRRFLGQTKKPSNLVLFFFSCCGRSGAAHIVIERWMARVPCAARTLSSRSICILHSLTLSRMILCDSVSHSRCVSHSGDLKLLCDLVYHTESTTRSLRLAAMASDFQCCQVHKAPQREREREIPHFQAWKCPKTNLEVPIV